MNEFYCCFDKMNKKMKHDSLINYLNFMDNGFSIKLSGRDFLVTDLHKSFLNQLFTHLSFSPKDKNIIVLSIIGYGKLAKSSILNSIFGCNFNTSESTTGIQMNYLKYEDKIIILLDTESLNENKIHDCQLTSIILLISHIVLINSKSELSELSSNYHYLKFKTLKNTSSLFYILLFVIKLAVVILLLKVNLIF